MEALALNPGSGGMRRFGKPDQTGRSSGKRTKRDGQYLGPPKGEPFAWQPLSLLESPAWRAMSPNTRKLVDRLMIEHMHHAGSENGNLIVTHQQFIEYGLTAGAIREAVEEANFLGLIRYERGGRWACKNTPSTYRLTWIGDKYGCPPTNEWKGIEKDKIDEWKADRKHMRSLKRARPKKQDAAPKSRSTVPLNPTVSTRQPGNVA